MSQRTVAVCVDGLDPEYLDACDTPNLSRLAAAGFLKIGRGMMPSVTNVNNVPLATASRAERHGISSNYRLLPDTGEGVYMETSEYILAETMFQRARRMGRGSILSTSKDKLRTLLGDGASVAISSERPPEWVVGEIGEPPEIYSLEVNGWAVRAAALAMSRHEVDFAYVTTTDYAMHTYAPGEPESQAHLTMLDDAIGELVDAHPDVALLLTADHGMSAKSRMVDLGAALSVRGIEATPVPIIKDRYVVHHSNLGGSMFVYLHSPGDLGEALKVLSETDGVEEALSREEAAARFGLHRERIGDVVVTGSPDVVFGAPPEVSMPARLRTHGSVHETAVPILGYNGRFDGFAFEENRDVGRYIMERVLA